MKLVGFVRTWNEKDIIHEVISRNRPLFDELIVIDKGSTDGTFDILQSLNLEHLYRIEAEEDREIEDRRIGFNMARVLKPDWIIQFDSDEILWSFSQSPREVLSRVPGNIDAVSIQAIDFFWNPADPEPFINDGQLSILENRKYVLAGHRWVTRISRPLPYLQYHTAVRNPRELVYLKDIVFRHYSLCISPARNAEKIARYQHVRAARESEGVDMSFIDKLAQTDFFAWDPEILIPFSSSVEFRNSLLSWETFSAMRAIWLDDLVKQTTKAY